MAASGGSSTRALEGPVVGNDVVDLEDPRLRGKPEDGRFVTRVLSAAERETLAASCDPDLELWCQWAAKEAAYKIVSKLRQTPPPFTHAAFVSRWSLEGPSPSPSLGVVRAGTVAYEGMTVAVEVTRHPGALHAVAHAPVGWRAQESTSSGLDRLDAPTRLWGGDLVALLPRFTEREVGGIHSRRSAVVRLAARADLALVLAVPEERLELVTDPGPPGRRPVRVVCDGRPAPVDVSLSHDGAWIGWAFGLASSAASDQPPLRGR